MSRYEIVERAWAVRVRRCEVEAESEQAARRAWSEGAEGWEWQEVGPGGFLPTGGIEVRKVP